MFKNTLTKLEDTRINLEAMVAAKDAVTFRSVFSSFLGNCRAITYALQKEGSRISKFAVWYSTKQEEMKQDGLLRFIHEARTEDFHEGKHRLQFSAYIEYLSSNSIGPPPKPGACLVIGAQGPFWLTDKGTVKERKIPISQGSRHTVSIYIANPPMNHLGKPLGKNDPITIASLALEYMEKLVFEARNLTKD